MEFDVEEELKEGRGRGGQGRKRGQNGEQRLNVNDLGGLHKDF